MCSSPMLCHDRAMSFSTGTFTSPVDGLALATYAWDDVAEPRAVVQIAHGLAEHSARYDRLATALNAAGYLVRATDHRGHGRSITETPGDFGDAGFDGLIADVAASRRLAACREPGPATVPDRPLDGFVRDPGGACWSTATSTTPWCCPARPRSTSSPSRWRRSDGPAGLEAFNVGFEHRTGYEWLSRDEAEVDRYVADPLCGFDLPDETVPSLFGPAARLANPSTVRADLPLLIISGDADPLAGGGALVELLGQRYRDAGVSDVTVKLYEDARHEIFNETNRDEITRDVIRWLDARG